MAPVQEEKIDWTTVFEYVEDALKAGRRIVRTQRYGDCEAKRIILACAVAHLRALRPRIDGIGSLSPELLEKRLDNEKRQHRSVDDRKRLAVVDYQEEDGKFMKLSHLGTTLMLVLSRSRKKKKKKKDARNYDNDADCVSSPADTAAELRLLQEIMTEISIVKQTVISSLSIGKNHANDNYKALTSFQIKMAAKADAVIEELRLRRNGGPIIDCVLTTLKESRIQHAGVMSVLGEQLNTMTCLVSEIAKDGGAKRQRRTRGCHGRCVVRGFHKTGRVGREAHLVALSGPETTPQQIENDETATTTNTNMMGSRKEAGEIALAEGDNDLTPYDPTTDGPVFDEDEEEMRSTLGRLEITSTMAQLWELMPLTFPKEPVLGVVGGKSARWLTAKREKQLLAQLHFARLIAVDTTDNVERTMRRFCRALPALNAVVMLQWTTGPVRQQVRELCKERHIPYIFAGRIGDTELIAKELLRVCEGRRQRDKEKNKV